MNSTKPGHTAQLSPASAEASNAQQAVVPSPSGPCNAPRCPPESAKPTLSIAVVGLPLAQTCLCAAWRTYAHQPESAVYGGPQAPAPAQVTLRSLQQKYGAREPISMVTAYDYPSAVHVCPHSLYMLLLA